MKLPTKEVYRDLFSVEYILNITGTKSLDAAVVDVGGFVFCSPQQDSNLTPVHENEALALVGDVGAEATTHNAMPGRKVHVIKFALDDLRDVVKDTALSESECNAVDGVLLHVFVHIGILDDCVFRILLIDSSMGLHDLSVGFSLPILCLGSLSVSCNLRDSLRFSLGLHIILLL